MESANESPSLNQLVIVGVGLIGGSIARAARSAGLARRIIGVGRNPTRLAEAIQAGVIDQAAQDATELNLDDSDLVVVCLPVGLIADSIRQISIHAPTTPITDAGSTKASIYRRLEETGGIPTTFVGGHPIAGGEQGGWEASTADLFQDKLTVLTPEQADTRLAELVASFWKALGSDVRPLSPEKHDQILAATSHLPHLLAAAAVHAVAPDLLDYTGTGFRDTTRVASGNAELWTQILQANRLAVKDSVEAAIQALQTLQTALSEEEEAAIHRWLETARARRESLLTDNEDSAE